MEGLYPYQIEAVEWMLFMKRGILADEQGLGKTVMAIKAMQNAGAFPALIICSEAKCDDWLEHESLRRVLIWTYRKLVEFRLDRVCNDSGSRVNRTLYRFVAVFVDSFELCDVFVKTSKLECCHAAASSDAGSPPLWLP